VYDVGAIGSRLAGTNNNPAACVGIVGVTPALTTPFGGCNFVQGLNGPVGYGAIRGEDAAGHIKTYQGRTACTLEYRTAVQVRLSVHSSPGRC
jgi:hypothetical protein